MAFLIDTNVLSELRRPRPERRVVDFVAGQSLEDLYVSAVTLAELRYGIRLVANTERQRDLQDWLDHRVRIAYAGRVLAISEEVMVRWRHMVETGRRAGHTYSQPDLIIAATAAEHRLVVVTRDRREFDRAGVPALNPWTD